MTALYCRSCHHRHTVGLSERLVLLRGRGKLVRDKAPDPAVVDVLFDAELPSIPCPRCGKTGLETRPDLEDALDDEEWGEARRCAGCGTAIPAERLEILPDTRMCTACASAGASTESDEREFCPRCGSEMRVSSDSGRGLARYVLRCLSCGYRG